MGDFKAEFEGEDVVGAVKVKQKAFTVWIFRLILLAAVGWTGTERLNVSRFLPTAKDVAKELVADEAFKHVLQQELLKALRQIETEEQAAEPAPRRQNTRRQRPRPPAPPRGALREGEMITTQDFLARRAPPWEGMEKPR